MLIVNFLLTPASCCFITIADSPYLPGFTFDSFGTAAIAALILGLETVTCFLYTSVHF
jgi:putative membrane protein